MKERKVYEKAGRPYSELINDNTEPGLKLSIKHAEPVFGTDFDVFVEVCRAQNVAEWKDGRNGYVNNVSHWILCESINIVRYFQLIMNPFFLQVKNEGGREVQAQLTVHVSAATYNSIHHGECKRQKVTVTVPAHKG